MSTIHPADFPGIAWRKSSWSAYNGNCVEVAELTGGMIGVRDSKNPGGPALTFQRADWRAFLEQARKATPAG